MRETVLVALAADFASVAERLRRGTVTVVARGHGAGSGTVWGHDGLIVTNHHVSRGEDAEVVTWDDRKLAARSVAHDRALDLSLLRVAEDGLEGLDPADSDALRVGQIVLAAGNPWGRRGSVTAGIVMAIGKEEIENRVPLESAIRADVSLAPGNSGGPLADAAGRVIGVNAMIAGGIAIAVPSNAVSRFLAEGRPEPGFLGVGGRVMPLPPAIATAAGLRTGAGLLITEVVEASPAEAAGLLPGDLLVAPSGTAEGIAAALREMRAGVPLRLRLVRAGRLVEIDAVPAQRAA